MDKWSDFDTYLRGEHLGGRKVTATIADVTVEEFHASGNTGGTERKPVLWFKESPKGLIISNTNRKALAALFGDDVRACVGKRIQLEATPMRVAGRNTLPIRISAAAAPAFREPAAPAEPAETTAAELLAPRPAPVTAPSPTVTPPAATVTPVPAPPADIARAVVESDAAFAAAGPSRGEQLRQEQAARAAAEAERKAGAAVVQGQLPGTAREAPNGNGHPKPALPPTGPAYQRWVELSAAFAAKHPAYQKAGQPDRQHMLYSFGSLGWDGKRLPDDTQELAAAFEKLHDHARQTQPA